MYQTHQRIGRTTRYLLAGTLALACGLGGSSLHADATAAPALDASQTTVTAVDTPAVRPRPTIAAPVAWELIEADLEQSPWLRNADEFAAWVDGAGNDCQQVTRWVAEHLRELDYLLNEHWIGRRAENLLVAGAGTAAALSPDLGLSAGALAVVIKTSPQWTEALAKQADDLGAWIESATEHWERYAEAYAAVSDDPNAATIAEWMAAAETLVPYLERGEHLVTELNKHLATIDKHLAALQEDLEGIDHWAVEWLADEVNEHIVDPSLAKLREVQPRLQMAQGRLMIDQALLTTMPLRFAHRDIVD